MNAPDDSHGNDDLEFIALSYRKKSWESPKLV
jgi:hypothetical protein